MNRIVNYNRGLDRLGDLLYFMTIVPIVLISRKIEPYILIHGLTTAMHLRELSYIVINVIKSL